MASSSCGAAALDSGGSGLGANGCAPSPAPAPAPEADLDADEARLEPAQITVPAEEFAELVPPGAEFRVKSSTAAGRYMVSSVKMDAGYDFLVESPLVAWPLAPEVLRMCEPEGDVRAGSCTVTWCEGCFSALPATMPTAACGADGGRRVRRRLVRKQSPSAPAPGEELPLCENCCERRRELRDFLTPELLERWRRWQASKSPKSKVGLEAFARCIAQVATTAARLRACEPELAPDVALNEALRPFERLAAPPAGHFVLLDGTSSAELSELLRTSEPFADAVASALGCEASAAQLLAESSIDALAGRLVLNAAGVEVQGAGPGQASLPAVGVFVLLSTMNHDCTPSVEVVPSGSTEVTLRTVKPVEPGEPLTISYVPLEWPRVDRRTRLRHWYFDCDCLRCESEAKVAAALSASGC